MVDTQDLKSCDCCGRSGSSPDPGTEASQMKYLRRFFVFKIVCSIFVLHKTAMRLLVFFLIVSVLFNTAAPALQIVFGTAIPKIQLKDTSEEGKDESEKNEKADEVFSSTAIFGALDLFLVPKRTNNLIPVYDDPLRILSSVFVLDLPPEQV
jgi:hypothetical protein